MYTILCVCIPTVEGEIASVFQPAGCLPGESVDREGTIVMQRQAS